MSDKIIMFIIGFIPGGILGFYLASTRLGREYTKRFEALTDDNRELRKKLYQNKFSAEKTEENLEDQIENLRRTYISPEPDERELEDDEEPDVVIRSKDDDEDGEEDEDDDQIRIITVDEFKYDISSNRDSERLTYYQEDGVLVDDKNQRIKNEERYIGIEALDMITDTDLDSVYVSNDADDIVYEINIEHNESYYRDLMR